MLPSINAHTYTYAALSFHTTNVYTFFPPEKITVVAGSSYVTHFFPVEMHVSKGLPVYTYSIIDLRGFRIG